MEFLSSHHGYPLGAQHPFVAVPTIGEWFSTFFTVSCHPPHSQIHSFFVSQ